MPAPSGKNISRSITGVPAMNAKQLYEYFMSRNPLADKAEVKRLSNYYVEEARAEGINSDIAFAQMCVETGFLRFGNLVTPEMHNYCGLGAIDSEHRGEVFANERLGVRAHIQHLLAYSRKERPTKPIVDPRYELIRTNRPDIYGKLTNWTQLNGIWAVPGKNYGQEILIIRDTARTPDGSDAALRAANAASSYNILHICGYAGHRNELEWYKDYDAKTINWAAVVEGVPLEEGRRIFPQHALLGGFGNLPEDVLYRGTRAEIEAETERILAAAGRTGVLLGADCTVPRDIDWKRFDWVRGAAGAR